MGNRAVARLLARAPETWYRGEGVGVLRAKPGGVVHDLADGLYFIDDSAAAQGYADLRAGKPGGGSVVGARFDRRLLGKVLDLTTDDRWSKFINDAPPVATMGKRWRDYMAKGSEPYNAAFREYLGRYKIVLADYDAVIAQDFIRNPNAKQLVITNPRIAEKIDDIMARVNSHAPRSRPAPPVTVKVGGSPGRANPDARPRGPSAPTRGGPGADGPQMQTDASGRVLLYRAIRPSERDALIRHGDFEWAPSGGGKYFSFSRTDALEVAKKLYGPDVTIVETAVPRGLVPDQPDTGETVAQPHLPPKGGTATMIRGEIYVFYDPRAGGWTLHVDDDALLALNAQMIRPRIIDSTLPTVGQPSGSVLTPHDGGHDHDEPVLTESAGRPGWPGTRVGTGRPTAPAEPEIEEEDANGGLTQDEIEALTTPDAVEAMAGRGNWSLLALIGSAVIQNYLTSMTADIEQATIDRVNQQIAAALTPLTAEIVALQEKGDIAYAQVTVKKTVADSLTVFDLESVAVSEWFKQGNQTEGGVRGVLGSEFSIAETHQTMSFALSLHPVVLARAMTKLNGRLKDVDAEILRMTRAGQRAPAALRAQRRSLRSCASRLAQLGPRRPSFAHVGGDCLDLLPLRSGI